jgi:hypothetical protein
MKKISSISVTEVEVESLLRKVKNTSAGFDNIPCWVFYSGHVHVRTSLPVLLLLLLITPFVQP